MLVSSYLHFYDLVKVMVFLLGLQIELVENVGQIQDISDTKELNNRSLRVTGSRHEFKIQKRTKG